MERENFLAMIMYYDMYEDEEGKKRIAEEYATFNAEYLEATDGK